MMECPECKNTCLLYLEDEKLWQCRSCGAKFNPQVKVEVEVTVEEGSEKKRRWLK